MTNLSMELRLHDWDMDDIKKELEGKGLLAIVEKYEAMNREYTGACMQYTTCEEEVKDIHLEDCNRILRQKILIALTAMEKLAE